MTHINRLHGRAKEAVQNTIKSKTCGRRNQVFLDHIQYSVTTLKVLNYVDAKKAKALAETLLNKAGEEIERARPAAFRDFQDIRDAVEDKEVVEQAALPEDDAAPEVAVEPEATVEIEQPAVEGVQVMDKSEQVKERIALVKNVIEKSMEDTQVKSTRLFSCFRRCFGNNQRTKL